jgi:hypothetical protein
MIPIKTTKSNPPKNIFEIFIENPKLKNIFEINYNVDSYIQTRKQVEDLLFAKAYKDCDEKLRPKYGSINILPNIEGDKNCLAYGQICLKYKDNIKDKTTFTFGDSFSKMMYICTYNYLEHILYHFDKNTLNILIDLVNSNNTNNNISISTYIEAQIHGDIDISKDIENIRIPNNIYNDNKDIINKFINKYPNIEILIY